MALLDKLKNQFGEKLLARDLKKRTDRKIESCNLNNAVSVGFLIEIKDENDYKKLLKIERYFKEEFGIKRIFGFAYYNDKNVPEFLKSSIGFDFISKKNIDWKGLPHGTEYTNFISEKFDVLIDLNKDPQLIMKYLMFHSKAKFKLGRFSEDNVALYDLMIDFQEEDLEEYINQVVHYLNMINPQ